MLTHVLDKIGVERDAHASHFIIFIHALVAESILKQTRADAVLLILRVNLTIEHLVILFNSDKVFVDFWIGIAIQLWVVLSDQTLGALFFTELEFQVVNCVSDSRQQIMLFQEESFLVEQSLKILDTRTIEHEVKVFHGLTSGYIEECLVVIHFLI